MKNCFTNIRVRYGETDQMGVVHHGKYAQYFEMGRIDWLDQFAISYAQMEREGIIMPVRQMNIKYLHPARFDDLITVETSLREIPDVRIKFDYKIFDQQNKLLTKATTELVFVNAATKKPISCPDYILEKIKK